MQTTPDRIRQATLLRFRESGGYLASGGAWSLLKRFKTAHGPPIVSQRHAPVKI